MKPSDAANEEQLSVLLAACDDAMAQGTLADPEAGDAPSEVRARLQDEIAWCRLVRRLLTSGDADTKQQEASISSAVETRLPLAPAACIASAPAEPLDRLGRFEIRRELGRGGCGVVFLAYDPKLQREVALKIPRPEVIWYPELRARFAQEARAAASLDHPNVVPIYEAGDEGAICYIASAYCPGITLSAWLKERATPVAADVAARLLATLAEAVEHAHRRGILHRDLKPANVMLSARPTNGESTTAHQPLDFIPRIMDFGLAKLLDAEVGSNQTQSGAIVGTPNYMAPEQASGQSSGATPATDVYALGAILYEVLTGQPPILGGSVVNTLLLVQTQEPTAPARLRFDVPRDLETICLKCLHKDPRKRYASAQALADDLHRFLARQPIQARRVGVWGRTLLWCRRNPALAATIAAAVLTIAAVAGAGIYNVLQERNRYLQERDHAQANLYRALVGEARAVMQARDTGWWWKALDNIRQAGALEVADRDPAELRELAIECMGSEFPCMRLHGTWTGHTGPIRSVALSADGRLAASASADRTVRVWSVPDGRPLAILSGHNAAATSVSFLPGAKWITSGSADGSLRSWSLAALDTTDTAKAPLTLSANDMFELHAGAINELAVSPDGTWLVAACQDGTLRVLPVEQGELSHRSADALTGHVGPVTCLGFSPSGQLASGGLDKTIRFWDLATRKQTKLLTTANAPNSLTFHQREDAMSWSEPNAFGYVSLNLDTNETKMASQIHTAAIRQIRYDRSKRAWTASADGTIKVWRGDGRNLREEAVARGDWGEVRTVAFEADLHWAVAGYSDGQVRLWEFAEPPQRSLLRQLYQSAAFIGDQRRLAEYGRIHDYSHGWDGPKHSLLPEPLHALTVQPNGRRFAFGDKVGRLTIADIDGLDRAIQFEGHTKTIHFVASSSDGSRLASASADGTVKLWAWHTGACERTLNPGVGEVHCLAWSKDDRHLAITGATGIAICDLQRDGECRQVRSHSLGTSAVALLADLLAFSGADKTIELCEFPSCRHRHTLRGHGADVSALALSPAGGVLASAAADGSVRLWNTDTGAETGVLKAVSLTGWWLSFDPTGRHLAGSTTHFAQLWDVPSRTPVAHWNGHYRCGQFAGDGSALLVGDLFGSVQRCMLRSVEKALAATQGLGKTPLTNSVLVDADARLVQGGHYDGVWAIAASPDGRWLATAGGDQTVKLWDVPARKLVRTLHGHQAMVWSVSFSPDSKYVASSSAEPGAGAVKVWEVATGREHRHFRGHRLLVRGLAFHPTEPVLASSAIDGSVCLWDYAAGKELGVLRQSGPEIYNLAFRPDGRVLAGGCMDKRIAVWDWPPASLPSPPTRCLDGHSAGVWGLAFSPDGRYLASASERGTIILWNGHTFDRVTALRGGTGQIRTLSFSRDSQLLAAAAYVSPTLVWDLQAVRTTLATLKLD